jgi:tripartite-type tricarboxylate transporter receptor subunit TctC
MKRSEFLRRTALTAGALAGAGWFPSIARADAWPTRPVRVVVPVTPGGPSDIVARAWSQSLGEAWKTSFVVDNKPGASQIIGTQAVVSAPPDGYTLLQSASSIAVMPLLPDKPPFDIERDLVAVSFTHVTPLVIVIDPRLPIKSVAELIQYAKQNPGKLSFGTTGEGSSQQMAVRLLARQAGLGRIDEIPYKGSSQAHPDLIAGRLSVMIDPVSAVAAHIRSGAVRALAVTTSQRVASFPSIPTAGESGLPGFEVTSWGGVFAPAGTPRAIVERIGSGLAETMARPETVRRFAEWGLIAKAGTAAEFDAFVKADMERWRSLMQAPRN